MLPRLRAQELRDRWLCERGTVLKECGRQALSEGRLGKTCVHLPGDLQRQTGKRERWPAWEEQSVFISTVDKSHIFPNRETNNVTQASI